MYLSEIINRFNSIMNTPKKDLIFFFFLIGSIIGVNNSCLQAQSGIKTDGYNKIYYDNGNLASEGFSEDGKPNGYWKTYHENGNIKSEGNRTDFKLSGIWKFYNDEGKKIKEITYENGLKNGKTRDFNASGALTQVTEYRNDSIHGIRLNYFPDGKLKQKTPYKGNLKDGQARIYSKEDGRVIWLIRYEKDAVINREAINRFDAEGNKTGLWIEFHPNEVKKLEGNYVNGKRDGIFKEYDENGKLLNIYDYSEGELVDNETSLDVIEQDKYYYPSGQIKRIETKQGSKKQGFTKTFDENGNVILSQIFINDTLYAEGNTDELGRKIGEWKYYWKNGKLKSTGTYNVGLKNGAWKYYFETGELEQEGFWKNDKLDGEWIWYFKDGKTRCIMHFENGLEDGDYIEYDQYNYVVAEGEYVEGLKDGTWYYSGGDHVEKGKYRDGLKDGEWEYYHYEIEPESLMFRGKFRDGAPDGFHVYYHKKDVPFMIKQFKAGIKNGEFIWYFEDGVERYKLRYEMDELKSVNGVPFQNIDEYVE